MATDPNRLFDRLYPLVSAQLREIVTRLHDQHRGGIDTSSEASTRAGLVDWAIRTEENAMLLESTIDAVLAPPPAREALKRRWGLAAGAVVAVITAAGVTYSYRSPRESLGVNVARSDDGSRIDFCVQENTACAPREASIEVNGSSATGCLSLRLDRDENPRQMLSIIVHCAGSLDVYRAQYKVQDLLATSTRTLVLVLNHHR